MNVAVNAMGGDHAPEMVVQGVAEAVSEFGTDITLVGHKKKVAKALISVRRTVIYHSITAKTW